MKLVTASHLQVLADAFRKFDAAFVVELKFHLSVSSVATSGVDDKNASPRFRGKQPILFDLVDRPMPDPLPAPRSFLREQALSALARCGGVRKNQCDTVAGEFAYSIEEEFGYTAHAPVKAPVQGRKHFVALVPAAETAFAAGQGYVIVDPTLQQFDEVLDEDLPEVAILSPGDEQRRKWYDTNPSP